MKLTIDARLITSSGIGVYIQNLIADARLSEFELKIIHRAKDYKFFMHLQQYTKFLSYNASLYSIGELIKTPAKTISSDVFWSPHYNVPVLNFAHKLKIVTIHDVYHLAYYQTLSLKQKIYAKVVMDRAVKSSDIIFTVSEFSKSEIIKYTRCSAQKVKVVYNGIDFTRFNSRLLRERQEEVLLKYKIDGPYVLFVGNVKPHKNLKKALEGFKEFIGVGGQQFSHVKFVIAGKREGFITGDNEVANLLTQSIFQESVLFTGWVGDEDLPTLYQRAGVFIFPSLYEGFGFPPLEAMAAGCPVISSNAACLPEVYEDAVLYFDPLRPEEIARALTTTFSDLQVRNDLIEKGYVQSKKYSWEAAIKKKINIIKQSL